MALIQGAIALEMAHHIPCIGTQGNAALENLHHAAPFKALGIVQEMQVIALVLGVGGEPDQVKAQTVAARLWGQQRRQRSRQQN